MRFSLPAFLLVFGALTACERRTAPPAPGPEEPPPDAVAQVGDEWLLQSDVDFLLQEGLAQDPTQALNELARVRQLALAARARGIHQTPAARRAGDQLLARIYLEHGQMSVAPVTEEEIATAWEKQKVRFTTPATYRVAILRQTISPSQSEPEAIRLLKEAREAYRQAAAEEHWSPPGFGEFAITYSDEPNTRFQGGLAGQVRAGQKHLLLPVQVTEAIVKHGKVGLLPSILVHEGCAWVILVMEARKAVTVPLAQAAPILKAELQQKRRQELKAQIQRRAQAQYPVKIPEP
jgi:hypothetical protein